ncbi:MAG: glutamate 5-kinase [Chloroflexota bacterium]
MKNKRIVIKFGTSVLTDGTHQLKHSRMMHLVTQCAELHRLGHELILVSSGAIAAGKQSLGFENLPVVMARKQMLAAVGQSHLMHIWGKFFDIYDLHVGQILLTRGDMENRKRYLNARDTLDALLAQQVIPIINENDAIATAEIKLGDNDNLSALVSMLADADLLILLTDQPGLFTADPRLDPDAKLIPEVNRIDQIADLQIGHSQSGLGVGGMITKLQAADYARRAGTDVVIAAGMTENVIIKIVGGHAVGTRIPALTTSLDSRKRWILGGPPPAGKITVDKGAAKALQEGGHSLLPAGIISVEGQFNRGAAVFIIDPEKNELARGIVRYAGSDLQQIKGCQSEQIAEQLGYYHGPVIVHRNDLILL